MTQKQKIALLEREISRLEDQLLNLQARLQHPEDEPKIMDAKDILVAQTLALAQTYRYKSDHEYRICRTLLQIADQYVNATTGAPHAST